MHQYQPTTYYRRCEMYRVRCSTSSSWLVCFVPKSIFKLLNKHLLLSFVAVNIINPMKVIIIYIVSANLHLTINSIYIIIFCLGKENFSRASPQLKITVEAILVAPVKGAEVSMHTTTSVLQCSRQRCKIVQYTFWSSHLRRGGATNRAILGGICDISPNLPDLPIYHRRSQTIRNINFRSRDIVWSQRFPLSLHPIPFSSYNN